MSPRCPHCGTTFADGARFCTRDGTALTIDAPARCGAPTRARARDAARRARLSGESRRRRPSEAKPAGRTRVGATRAARRACMRPRRGCDATGAAKARGLRHRRTQHSLARPSTTCTTSSASWARAACRSCISQPTSRTGERRAVKVLSPSLSRDQNAVARLGREAELAGRVRHPNVCHIERFGQTADGLVYVVMPYLEGEILADRTYRLRQLPLEEVVMHVADIAAGLQAAHDQQDRAP